MLDTAFHIQSEKSFESLESGLRLTARCDRLGHVWIDVRLQGVAGTNHRAAESRLELEAGSLPELAVQARRYFVEIDNRSV